jgi:uncharacterized protein YjdB
MPLGDTLRLDATVAGAADTAVTWASAVPAVATVDAAGLVTAAATGQATITATSRADPSRSAAAVITVDTVEVDLSPDSADLLLGDTLRFTAAVAGAVDGAVSWASSDTTVATVGGTGLVTARRSGTATVTATSAADPARSDAAAVRVDTVDVLVAPDSATVARGDTLRLDATVTGALDEGVDWSSRDDATATVDAAGLVTGGTPGATWVIARSDADTAVADSARIVVDDPAATVQVSPAYATVDAGASTTFTATARNRLGEVLGGAAFTWATAHADTATIAQNGTATGHAEGQTLVTALTAAVSDTARLVVLGPTSLLSTAFGRDSITAHVRAGDSVTVVVRLDLSRVSTDGDLGSVQFDLAFDPALLSFAAVDSPLNGTVTTANPDAGVFRFGFKGTQPQGANQLVLARVRFNVAANAAPGAVGRFDLTHTASPRNTAENAYPAPVSVDGLFVVEE